MTHYSLFPAGRAAWTSYECFDGDDALTSEECDALLAAAAATEPGAGLVGESVEDRTVRSAEVRDLPFGGDVLPVQAKLVDAALRANELWWGFDLTHLQKMQVCRYGPGDRFRSHTDWGPGFTTRKLSIAVVLNDPAEFDGGEWVFTSSSIDSVIRPERGMIMVFPSFLLHRVEPVRRGERWSATAWVEGPPFR
jgi:PKHD-type hydroxylase